MATFRIELPPPPTTNLYWRFAKNGIVYVSQQGKAYRRLVNQLVLLAPGRSLLPLEGRLAVDVQVIPSNKRRRDLDNYFKALLDSMTHAGVWQDDSQIDDLRIRRDLRFLEKESKIIVNILPLEVKQ